MSLYPIPSKRDFKITQHGLTRNDEYYWMRDRNDPEVKEYLQSENEYLNNELAHLKPLRENLFSEMKGRIQEVDSSVPVKMDEYFYYSRTEAKKQYPIHCRKKELLDAPEEILLDQNLLAEGHEFCSVSAFSVSPDHNKLIYSLDYEGAEVYTIYIKDLTNGELFPEIIPGTYGSVYYRTGVEWAGDSQTFFYLTVDEYHRSDKIFRHTLGADPKDDFLIFHEQDETFSLSIYKPRSKKFIMSYHYNTVSQEIRFIPADQPDSALKVLQPRQKDLEYYATHHGDSFLIITNHNAPNYKLVKTPLSSTGIENWEDVIHHRGDTLLEQIDAFEDFIVLQERRNGLSQLRISQADGVSGVHYVKFPDPTYEVFTDNNPNFKSDVIRIKYSSLITPPLTVNIHMDSGAWDELKEDEMGGYDKSQYVTEYIQAKAEDGKLVPISIAYKKGLVRNGHNPTLLNGYGAYGSSSEAQFNSSVISLLERGFVYAIGHVRGGIEMGREWYDEGKLYNKRNSFTDFIACAEHLIREGYTAADKIGMIGSSAGGLLVGASMVMRPDLFKAVICKVPFVDVITSMSDPTIPLTALEYDQWGNPENKKDFEYMLTYSPYDNLAPVEYPHLLLTAGFNDQRVSYWEPAKFLARLRAVKKGHNIALLRTNFSAGHAGSSGRFDYLKESALDFAFLIDKLNANSAVEN